MATPVGSVPTATGEPGTCVLVARLMMLTVLSAELATTARFSAGSMAMADGLWPTPMVAPGDDGNEAGSTAKFTAEIGGLGGTTSVFCTTIGYSPGTPGAAMVIFITRVVPLRV